MRYSWSTHAGGLGGMVLRPRHGFDVRDVAEEYRRARHIDVR